MKKSIALLAVVTMFYVTGCADKPKAIGGDILPPGDNIFVTTITASSDTSYKTAIANGRSTSNLVGKLPTGEEFTTLIDFYPTSIVDSLNGATIDTAEIRLIVNYRMLPSAPPINFKIYELLHAFAEGTFTADSLNPSIIGTTEVGSFADSMNYSQTVTARLTDTTVVRRWANELLDTAKPAFHGFVVRTLTNTGVIGFTPFNAFSDIVPKLVIKYTRNGYHDSLIFSSGQDTYAGTYAVSPTLADFEVRGGTGVHAKIKFSMNFTGKPMVAQSLLALTVDTLNSVYSGFSPDTLIGLYSQAENETDSSFFAYGIKKKISGSNPVYEFNITKMTQRWINNLTANHGVDIRWWDERSASERIVFYPMTDTTYAPALKIIYSEKNQ